MKAQWSVFVVAMFTIAGLAGCLGGPSEPDGAEDQPVQARTGLTLLREREVLPFDTTGQWSHTLVEGPLEMLRVLDVSVPVDLPVTELGGALVHGSGVQQAIVHMGVFLPSNVADGAKVPVIADVGPYYGDATQPAGRLGSFLIQNFVPHGYAVAQVSVFGSGRSTHCMDLMGLSEQRGVQAAVEWLGTQEWSNGAVGLIGRSYDGSTPWQAAMVPTDHLKTIVPISGLIGMYELMWRNGSAENRGPMMHYGVYGTYGLKLAPEVIQNACRGYVTSPVHGWGAAVTGDHFFPEYNDYWASRYFLDEALKNYEGSVYFIHGLQDWNVDPHMAFPTHHLLEKAGIDVKGLYGQWAHHYPDRPSEHGNLPSGRGGEAFPHSVRYDWAQDLLEWFDHYLKGEGPKPALHAEVQDNMGQWRVEASYPPRDLEWVPLALGTDLERVSSGDPVVSRGGSPVFFESQPMGNVTRIAGMPKFHVTVVPELAGGQLFAYLEDGHSGLRLGHAVMDLRFAAGGKTSQDVQPGQPLLVQMEFLAMDVVLGPESFLRLRLTETGMDYRGTATPSPVLIDVSARSNLILPIVERGPDVFFEPPIWWEEEPEEDSA